MGGGIAKHRKPIEVYSFIESCKLVTPSQISLNWNGIVTGSSKTPSDLQSFKIIPDYNKKENHIISRRIKKNELTDIIRSTISQEKNQTLSKVIRLTSSNLIDISNLSFRSTEDELVLVDENDEIIQEYKFYITDYR